VGDVVEWTWLGNNHTVTSGTFPNANNSFCSPDNQDCPGVHTSNNGAIYEHQFGSAGTFTYFCEIHGGEGMTGTVVVQP
jgi:plastocyanin